MSKKWIVAKNSLKLEKMSKPDVEQIQGNVAIGALDVADVNAIEQLVATQAHRSQAELNLFDAGWTAFYNQEVTNWSSRPSKVQQENREKDAVIIKEQQEKLVLKEIIQKLKDHQQVEDQIVDLEKKSEKMRLSKTEMSDFLREILVKTELIP